MVFLFKDLGYLAQSYKENFWGLKTSRSAAFRASVVLLFPILVTALSLFAFLRWGRTSVPASDLIFDFPINPSRTLKDFWPSSDGRLIAEYQTGWQVTLESHSADDGAISVNPLNLDKITPPDSKPESAHMLVTVPNVLGITFERADFIFKALGLSIGEVKWVGIAPGGVLHDGIILLQSPQGGVRVEKGTKIRLEVGNGRSNSRDPMSAPNSVPSGALSVIPQNVLAKPTLSISRTSQSATNQPASEHFSTTRTDIPLAVALSPNHERILWAWNGAGYVTNVSDASGKQLRKFDLQSSVQVVASAITDNGLIGLQYVDGTLGLYGLERNETLLKRSGGPCPLITSNNYLAYSCPYDASVSIFLMQDGGHLVERKFKTKSPSLAFPSISAAGGLAVPTAAGTVQIFDPLGTETANLTAPGLVQAVVFYDTKGVLVGGSFPGIHLLSSSHGKQSVDLEAKSVKALAVQPPLLAYLSESSVAQARIRSVYSANPSGIAILVAGAALLLGYFLIPLLRTYSEATLAVQETRIRRRYEAEMTIGGLDAKDTQPIPPLELPDDLVDAFAANNCIAYVGAGLSAQAGFPTWPYFVRELLSHVAKRHKISEEEVADLRKAWDQKQYDTVADNIVTALAGDEHYLAEYLRERFKKTNLPLPATHRVLREIPFSAILTTNFDELLEQAFSDRPLQVYTHKDPENLLGALTRRDFFLLKLYGAIEKLETLLTAPSQYIDAVSKNILFSQFMESLFFSRTMLFLGASLEGIEGYLEGIIFRGSIPHNHYALVSVTGSIWRAKAEQLQRRYGIRILPYHADEDHTPVLQFLQKLAEAVKADRNKGSTHKEPARLQSIRLENIGPFKDLKIDLYAHWNILLGDNGVGKSTIMKAVVVGICGEDARDYAGRIVRSGETSATITLETDQNKKYVTTILVRGHRAEVFTTPAKPLETEGWLALAFPPLRTFTWSRDKEVALSGQPAPSSDDLLPLARGESDPRLDTLKAWFIDLEGRIASAKIRMKGRRGKTVQEELRDDFFAAIASLTPGMKIEFQGVNLDTKEVIVRTDDGLVPIEAVSQGTTSLFGWVGILMQRLYDLFGRKDDSQEVTVSPRDRYALVLIDEIDAHMHPRWQQLIVRTLSKLFPKVQFVATTHSPLIVTGMDHKEVLVTRRDSSGVVIVERPDVDFEGWRADQILTGPLFGLPSTLDPKLHEAMQRYASLAARVDLSDSEKKELEEVASRIKVRLPNPQETQEARLAFELVEQSLNEKLQSMPAEKQKRILDEAKLQIQKSVTDSRKRS